MKDILIILGRNFSSPIVIAILILATTLLVLGERSDAWFISFVIVINTLFAIVQEVRAYRALKKLELMTAPHARRQRADGPFEEVMFDQLQPGDTIKLLPGDEIPADAEVTHSTGLEVDESILSGESAPVEKEIKDTVYAASAVTAGSAVALVTAVGATTKAGAMTATLKRYTPQPTPLQKAIARAITILTYGALLLAVLIFVVYHAAGYNAVTIFKTITSAAVTVVPEGLLLASSLLLAFGSLKLAQANVLPQKLSAIEAMALLKVLCVDKTGTLTSDTLTFEALEFFGAHKKQTEVLRDLVAIAAAASGGNTTSDAIAVALPAPNKYKIIETLAFSSQRKMSGVRVAYGGKTHTLLVGASEFLSVLAPIDAAWQKQITTRTREGMRVLLVAVFDDQKTKLKQLRPNSGQAVGILILHNALRSGVQNAVDYLQKNGVSLRVISGDNPQTVQYVARQVGIKGSHTVVTGAELAKLSDSGWSKTVMRTTIFARVLPEQKERLIATFQKHKAFTGMVGDGVNDALALKKADLSVAMFAGATATRRVADIVLLDNSFSSLPLGMHLGNRIMQAIEVIAVLFFHKIIYSVLLLLATLALGLHYPFDPRHVTFMNIFLVTLPTIMWTLFPPTPKYRVQPNKFWRDTLLAVTPIGLLTGAAVTFCYWAIPHIGAYSHKDTRTIAVIVATFFGVYLVFLASKMLAIAYNHTVRLAWSLYIFVVGVIALATFGTPVGRDFFGFTQPNWWHVWPLLFVLAAVAVVQYVLATVTGNRLRQKHYAKPPED